MGQKKAPWKKLCYVLKNKKIYICMSCKDVSCIQQQQEKNMGKLPITKIQGLNILQFQSA